MLTSINCQANAPDISKTADVFVESDSEPRSGASGDCKTISHSIGPNGDTLDKDPDSISQIRESRQRESDDDEEVDNSWVIPDIMQTDSNDGRLKTVDKKGFSLCHVEQYTVDIFSEATSLKDNSLGLTLPNLRNWEIASSSLVFTRFYLFLTRMSFLASTLYNADPLFTLVIAPGFFLHHVEAMDQDRASDSL